jgi:hypothetical protein
VVEDKLTSLARVFICFATFLHIEGYAISTIFTYLAGIPSFYTSLGISVSLSRLECPSLYLFRQGLHHLAPPTRGPKKGLDLSMLHKFRHTLDLSDGHDLALWAAIVVGFFSFLWASNLVPRSAWDLDRILFLQCSDVKFTDERAILKV